MKRFDEIYQSDPKDPEFLEERLPRPGAGGVFASQSRAQGNKAWRFFDNAMMALKNNVLVSGAKRAGVAREGVNSVV